MKIVILIASSLLITGCANTVKYQPLSWYSVSGGYTEQEISQSLFKIKFSGNNTDLLTVQTYWLYRAANLTLEKGFDGFEILDPSSADDPTKKFLSSHYRVRCPDLNLICSKGTRTPWIDALATIRVINAPIDTIPYKLFNARTLKEQLEPIVNGKDCGDPGLVFGTAKVCPHDKSYLVAQ